VSGRYDYELDQIQDEPHEIPVPDFGPFDIEVAPDDDVARVDLGALHVPNIEGVALQLEAAPTGQIVRVQLEHDGSRLQLGAFAAPRTEGIWDELRAELRDALLANGAKVVEVQGDYGPQLAARVPGAQGAAAMDTRHIGIDGPRWFVHAVLVGPAAVDPDRAGPLHEVLRGLLVDRGSEPRPVKEALPLVLPPEYAAQVAEAAAAQAASTEPQAGPGPSARRAAGQAEPGPSARRAAGQAEPGPRKSPPAPARRTRGT